VFTLIPISVIKIGTVKTCFDSPPYTGS